MHYLPPPALYRYHALLCIVPALPLLCHCSNVVRFIGACCELPAGLTDALAEAAATAAAAAATAAAAGGSGSSSGSMSSSTTDAQQQQQQYVVPARLARGVKLAIVMELCHLGSLFSMIGQVSIAIHVASCARYVPHNTQLI
jgi:hypothetical protein